MTDTFSNAEDYVRRGCSKEDFKKLYVESCDPWFTLGSQAEQLRLERTAQAVNRAIRAGDQVLDFGSGNRILTNLLVGHVTPYDWAWDEEFPEGQYDAVCCFEVLYYADDWQEMLKKLTGLLKPKGVLCVSITVRGINLIDESDFRVKLRKYFTDEYASIDEFRLSIDWYGDREYRESNDYKYDLNKGNGSTIQKLFICRRSS